MFGLFMQFTERASSTNSKPNPQNMLEDLTLATTIPLFLRPHPAHQCEHDLPRNSLVFSISQQNKTSHCNLTIPSQKHIIPPFYQSFLIQPPINPYIGENQKILNVTVQYKTSKSPHHILHYIMFPQSFIQTSFVDKDTTVNNAIMLRSIIFSSRSTYTFNKFEINKLP